MLIAIFFIYYFLFFIHSLETAVSTKVETYDTCRIINWQRIVALGIHLVFFSAILWWSKWWIFCLADVLGCLSYHVDMVWCFQGIVWFIVFYHLYVCIWYTFHRSCLQYFSVCSLRVCYYVFLIQKSFFFRYHSMIFSQIPEYDQLTNHTKYFSLIVWSCHFSFSNSSM